ncbi:MAG: exo-alpha-sialidase [Bacteroidia bacterium]|nr:exo-alpha-sialidase [Bacteroidia bacterium]
MKKISLLLAILTLFFACSKPRQAETANQLDLLTKPDSTALFGPGYVSTPLNERDLAINPAGTELIFTRGNHTYGIRALISIKKFGEKWEEASILPFSGSYHDLEPFFSPDDQKLFFASNRPIAEDSSRKDYNIWYVERRGDSWSEPFALDSLINTRGNEFFPAVGESGNLYFTAAYPGHPGGEDIYLSKWENGNYTAPIALDSAVNSPSYEFNAYVSPKEDIIVFSSFGRADGKGGGDLYLSKKDEAGNWQKAYPLTAINTPALDYCPFIDLPRGNLYFTSNSGEEAPKKLKHPDQFISLQKEIRNRAGNIYRIDLDQIMQ